MTIPKKPKQPTHSERTTVATNLRLDTSALVAYRNAERDLMGTLAEINRVFDVKVGDLGQLQKQLASDSAKCSAALLDFPRPGGKS